MIVVAGGTGRLGKALITRLRARSLPVRVFTRDAGRADSLRPLGVEVTVGDVRNPSDVSAAVGDAKVVVSALHGFAGPGRVTPESVDRQGNRNLFDAATAAGASVAMMSVVGASPDSPLELFRAKADAEGYLRASGVPWTILRSAAFIELWIDLLEQTAAKSGQPVVFGRGDVPIEFVSVSDVADALVYAIVDESLRNSTVEIGSPERWTFTELATAVQEKAGRTKPPRHVPPLGLRMMAAVAGPFNPELARQARAAVVMDRETLPSADGSFRLAHPELEATSIAEVIDLRSTGARQ